MRVVATIEGVRDIVGEERSQGRRVGFVPTMGALHEGHLSLVTAARELAEFVVLSIFVNPTQFGPDEDFAAYPRILERDLELAESAGVDLVFAPSVSEIYAPNASTEVRVTGLSGPLCGEGRPGHFDGVALVVTKLLNIVRPDVSVFGQKDAQQALLIRRLARDLHLPGKIHVAPTVREPGGLALSSRNRYLSEVERKAAGALSRGLFSAEALWEKGERRAESLLDAARAVVFKEPLVSLDYLELVSLDDLEPWSDPARPALLAVAAHVGSARLIDNVVLGGSLMESASHAQGRFGVNGMAIILAAGEGKRMKSDLPKVLHEVGGKPLVAHVADAARGCGLDRIVVVIGNGADLVRDRFQEAGWEFVEQTERLGTGDAVRRAKSQLESFDGDVVVLAGDVPLLSAATLSKLWKAHREADASATVLTAKLPDATGYGRIVRDLSNGQFLRIVEHKDASEAERQIDEVNSSIYCFQADALRSVLWKIGSDNAQNEIYLTDAIGLLRESGRVVQAVPAASADEIRGVNTREQLAELEAILSGTS